MPDRRRRVQVPDPHNPARMVGGDWGAAVALPAPSWVETNANTVVAGPARAMRVTVATLFCPQGTDVQFGDEISDGGLSWIVDAIPTSNVNPFTGWRPPMEVPLREVTG